MSVHFKRAVLAGMGILFIAGISAFGLYISDILHRPYIGGFIGLGGTFSILVATGTYAASRDSE